MFKVFKTSGIEGNYTISANPLFVSNNCWAIYPAKHKTTKKSYSVWQFQKRDWETRLTNDGMINKNNKKLILTDIYENIRLFIGNQSKIKHPNFLTVIEPLEDHKNRILFVTEYIVNDLNNIDKNELDEIMITKGLLQVSNGLKFLHESVKSVDLNLNPSSIVITENFDWKICGLTFLENLTNGISEKYIDPIDSRLPSFLSIDFRFSSPNLLINHKIDYINDLFSLCCIIYFLFNNGEYIIKCSQCSSLTEYERQINKVNNILQSIKSNNNKHAFFDKIPDTYYNVLIDILENSQESNTDVIQLNKNISINDIIESNIFNNELIKILNVIDEFTTLPNLEKINFLKNLKFYIEKFPKPLLINKFIPILISVVDFDQFKKNNSNLNPETEELIIESCENLIILSKTLSQLTFTDKVFPFILTLLKKLQFDGFKILLLKNLVIIRNCLNASIDKNSTNESFQKFSLDLFNKCISEQNSMAVQELTLINLKTILQFQPYVVIKSDILPKICTIYSTTTSLKIKNLTLASFIIMISESDNNSLDGFVIVDTILPLIYNTSSANYANTKFTNNILKLYNSIFDKLSKSTTKTFNTKGTETELYDIIMQIGFNIWKIGKLVTNKQDLNVIYNTWDKIERYLKNELDSKIIDNGNSETVGEISSPVSTSSNIFSSNKISIPTPVNNSSLNSNLNMSINKNNDFKSNAKPIQVKSYTSNMDSFDIMTANKNLNLNSNNKIISNDKNNNASNINSTLSFGQINNKPIVSSISNNSNKVNTSVDWSKAETSYSVMQPTNKTAINSNNNNNNNNNNNSSINWNLADSSKNSVNNINSFGVMKPTSKNIKKVQNNFDDEDDAWGDFAVGSTIKNPNNNINNNNNWNGSLI